ncbi:Keratin, type II cytoskeletal 8 [Liparis tanakae]|uniref:Keratin, type II cytoskeletal 8 n=1 Tax=Liparis tanakae TaxID=230148 RepID=A0A4Z2G2P2_9TELE|nr:Keratin, type II cytoskeletal 8 [Liparis tanakae]
MGGGGFSYPTGVFGGAYGGGLGALTASMTAIQTNLSLLDPIDITIDPNIQIVRTQERDQIKGLNNRFADLIDKVRSLEVQNKKLETKWGLLQQHTTTQVNIDGMFEAYIGNVRKQLDGLGNEKGQLGGQLGNMQTMVEDFKNK